LIDRDVGDRRVRDDCADVTRYFGDAEARGTAERDAARGRIDEDRRLSRKYFRRRAGLR
jgi:hypothetical protein